MLKRTFDFIFSLLSLIIVLPVLILVSVLIVITSKGVFFIDRLELVKTIKILKF
jgi:lipopolysaccharide/colanic/teichoic acid biosynthesis glycosyltransferase